MAKAEEVREALRDFIQRTVPGQTMLCTVKSVDTGNRTCTLVDEDDLEYKDVRLRPVIDGNEAVTIFPKVNSWAIAERIEGEADDWIVIAVGEADKVRVKVNNALLEITASGIKVQNNSETLKEILNDLMTAIQQITVNVTAVGSPTGVPINAAAFSAINTRINSLLT